jgi:hypothetical protein
MPRFNEPAPALEPLFRPSGSAFVVLIFFCTCGCIPDGQPENRKALPSTKPLGIATVETLPDEEEYAGGEPIDIQITPVGLQSRTKICVRAGITNISTRRIGLDSEFSVHLKWELFGDEDTRWALSRPGGGIKQTKETLSTARFVQLEPGGMLSKEVALTSPFRNFGYKFNAFTNGEPGGFSSGGYELYSRYEIPLSTRTLKLRLIYSCDIYTSLPAQDMFGFREEDVNVWFGRKCSNWLVYRFPDNVPVAPALPSELSHQ